VPILRNQKHEIFAQELAKGETVHQAYINAGFRAHYGNSSRLRGDERISARVLEIQQAAATSAEVTVASLLAELEEARSKATSLNQLSAAVRATAEKAKISSLLVEKQQVEVITDQYEPQTANEVLARILARLGEKPARALAETFNIEFDLTAIMAVVNGAGVNSNGVNSAKAIEWHPPRADRKRELG